MLMSDAKKNTIRRFTNLLDGGIIPSASVATIIDYYEELKVIDRKKINVLAALNKECSITSKFREAEIAEMEDDENEY